MPAFRCRGMATAAIVMLGLVCTGTSVYGTPVTLSTVPAYAYNVSPAPDGQIGIIGCGPTTGAMILGTYWALQPSPLAAAREMGAPEYMNTNAAGYGSSLDFQMGLEEYALDQGYLVDAVVHVEPTSFNAANWVGYAEGADLAKDATFWNTSTWDINDSAFLAFLQVEIDAGRPVSITVDSNGDGGTDHWMVGVGYDLQTGQWAGYDTWHSTLQWYDVESAFIAGNPMGIGFIRTFEFQGATGGGGTTVPDAGSSMLLMGIALAGLRAWGTQRS